jgi:hypothetical protein
VSNCWGYRGILHRTLTDFSFSSASPLNGEAALLWDSNQEDFKRKVLARHVEPSELEDN